ncbi:potassium channel subfamily K member 17-like, partial [Stegodyphus dumicola]|uniref:potassium channel subfamily K member 17-like n=1 Tax=Stegodyphus dumicola TaxID=202533 RepID=UPI0015A9269D
LLVLFTPGYGNVAPKSMWGKVFCIIYTFFGLPLNLVMMRLLSLKLRRGLRRTLKFVQQRYPLKIWLLWLSGMLFYLVFIIVFFLVPAGIFTYAEMWTYAQGIYFSFVSLATIGLGDYVADVSSSRSEQTFYPIYVVLMLIWLVFGIAFLSMTVNLLSYILGSNLLDKLDCKCRVRYSAKSTLRPVISNVAELNWQLAKYTPLGFRNSRNVQEFEELCISNPQNVTPHNLKSMLNLIYDLREVCYDQLEILDLDESDAIESQIEIVTDTEDD